MLPIADTLVAHDWFLRRRDLLALGYTDDDIRAELATGRIFRVRHGWYSVPQAPAEAVEAVRVGGRLTGRSALLARGIRVPRPACRQIVVPSGACRLRSPHDRRARLRGTDGCGVRWRDPTRRRLHAARASGQSIWCVSVPDAIAEVLRTESRDIAVACCDAVLNSGALRATELAHMLADAPLRAQRWSRLIDGRAASHGETFVRLWAGDAGLRLEPQAMVAGVGHLDGRISSRTYVEIDGRQHDEAADPGSRGRRPPSEEDRRRDAVLATRSGRALRFDYPLLLGDWPLCLAAMRLTIADDARREELELADVRHRARLRVQRERRTSHERSRMASAVPRVAPPASVRPPPASVLPAPERVRPPPPAR